MTAEVAKSLRACHSSLAAEGAIETIVITTTGDRVQDRRLEAIGGKGLFTKEIDEALLEERIDLAVNSAKDMPTKLPPGLVLAATPEREDPRDVFVSLKAKDLAGLPEGASIGTASLRRQAQVLHRRPDLKVVLFRGNVETRLRKLAAGEADATLLALAGLKRLGREDAATALISTEEILPAVGQGAMGLTSRSDDKRVRDLLSALDHRETFLAVAAERALLEELDGSCHTPIAALAEPDGAGGFSFIARLARPDGGALVEGRRFTTIRDETEAIALGHSVGEELRRRAGPGFF
jgi:hydroxymethylbilane synthase